METREQILARDFSEAFVTKMKNAVELAYYKYGHASKNFPELCQGVPCAEERIECYRKTHNKEYLVDAANFLMIEFMYPMFADAAYRPTDSDQSPGLAGGTTYKQMMEEMRE